MKASTLILGFILTMGLIAALATMARAQVTPCGPARTVFVELLTRLGEAPIWRGQAGKGDLVVTAGKDGSWTMIAVTNDAACIVAAGGDSELAKDAQ